MLIQASIYQFYCKLDHKLNRLVVVHAAFQVTPKHVVFECIAEFSRLPFVLLHMACPCHPYIQSLPTLDKPRDVRFRTIHCTASLASMGLP